ncbi:hemerythrin domain-containing protein [Sphingomonas oryzagri]|uniref:Hemerythrin domain-containing protein n=1 Tax=Sphingomonas oryzagri TaxID=3042314 RepID=A0ABT6N318_9SPHN|nr:hemerythrin domain-containing protein [Sphingomonas oryzagri]MDH7639467.1 hemerythrin domain-containing protein [Sphingomonas oryzagri]
MATATDTPSKATGAKANGTPIKANGSKAPARARKASVKSASKTAAPKTAPKRAVRRPAAPKTTLEKVSARVTAAEKSVAHAASETAHAIKAAADHAIEAAHVPDTAKGIVARVRAAPARLRKAVTPASKPAPRKGATGKAATARKPASKSSASKSKVGTGTVLGVAAAGLAVGIAANLGRKAAVQAPSVMAGDWLEALKAEHKAALAILDKLARSTPEQPAKRTLLLTQLKHALGKHAFTEENVIYPALREWGDKADADALNHEQGYHKQYLYELDTMDKAAPEFAQKIADFRADLNAHIREEEDKIFPKIHAGLDEAKNKALTAAANREGFKLA